jgi:hypothetical protein
MERLLSAWMVIAAALPACAQVQVPGGQRQPERPREQGAGEIVPALNIADAGELLTELETADRGLHSLSADVVYDKTFALAGDRQVRFGSLYYQAADAATPDTPRRFAIVFTRVYIDTRMQDDPITYAFDGEWFIERHDKEKQVIKRQVVPPGEHFDPLRIGEGPLPIPIGQKRAEIEKVFTAALLPPEDGLAASAGASDEETREAERLIAEVEDTQQVRLIPREGTEQARDFREVRLWYKRDAGGRLLPYMARTVSRDGNTAVVKLANVSVNGGGEHGAGVDAARRALLEPLPTGEGWETKTIEWRGEE